MKKFSSVILALVMALSLAVPAFAANTDAEQTLEIAAGVKSGAIDVTLPTAGSVVFNPYQLKATEGSNVSYHQIFFAPVKLTNKSTLALSVDVNVTAETEGNVELASAPVAATETGNKAFIYAEFIANKSATAQPVWSSAYNSKGTNQVVASAAGTDKSGVATLEETDGQTANYLWIKLDGSAAKKPSTAWTAEDKVSASIVFTLKPIESTVYPITVSQTLATGAKGSYSLNLDLAPAGTAITMTLTTENVSVPTVTLPKGIEAVDANTPIHADGSMVWTFKMPENAVAITVKWAAPAAG